MASDRLDQTACLPMRSYEPVSTSRSHATNALETSTPLTFACLVLPANHSGAHATISLQVGLSYGFPRRSEKWCRNLLSLLLLSLFRGCFSVPVYQCDLTLWANYQRFGPDPSGSLPMQARFARRFSSFHRHIFTVLVQQLLLRLLLVEVLHHVHAANHLIDAGLCESKRAACERLFAPLLQLAVGSRPES